MYNTKPMLPLWLDLIILAALVAVMSQGQVVTKPVTNIIRIGPEKLRNGIDGDVYIAYDSGFIWRRTGNVWTLVRVPFSFSDLY